MQSNTINTSGIHCKVATQGQVRRFFVPSTKYSDLLEKICHHFGFSKDSVVIKYADDEGDMVTISSDAEIEFAIEITKGGVLRLHVEQPQLAQITSDQDEGKFAAKWRHRTERLVSNPLRLQETLVRLKQKRDWLQSKHGADAHCGKLEVILSRIQFLETAAQSACQPSLPTEAPACASLPSSGSSSLSKEEILQQLDQLYPTVTAARLSLRQAHLQLQLQRANYHAAQHQLQNKLGQIDVLPDSSAELQLQQMKAELKVAKESQSTKKAELQVLMGRVNALRHQLKQFKHQYKSEWKDAKRHRKHCNKPCNKRRFRHEKEHADVAQM